MSYRLAYYPEVRAKDVPAINQNLRERISRAIETRLTTERNATGSP